MTTEKSNVTDYSIPKHWLALPPNTDKPVDVFYVYPTAWSRVDPAEPNYCSIDHPGMHDGAAVAFNGQATAFETSGNIYAPYYRQTDAVYALGLSEKQREEVLKEVPVADVITAFDYFIKNYNNGRPFILAGHSQGSNILIFLLTEYMAANPEVYKRMIAAYVIGTPVTEDFIASNKHLKFAEGPDDTGVIISYNTQSPNLAKGKNLIVGNTISLVINPLNWKRDETLAGADESRGSFIPDKNNNYVTVPAYADASIDMEKGVLICGSADEKVLFFPGLGAGVYHFFDYALYYYNLRENAERRVKKFLEK